MQQAQNNQNDNNNDQRMDPAAGSRKSWADSAAEKAQQPQNKQDYDNGPNHEISPFG
jgi:hypothetical protein